MLPATRMTNRSPRPWSNTISAGTRESEQPRMMANGSCPAVSSLRRAGPVGVSWLRSARHEAAVALEQPFECFVR